MNPSVFSVFFSVVFIANLSGQAQAGDGSRIMSIDERVDCELAVQDVYRNARKPVRQSDHTKDRGYEERARERVLRRLKMDRVLNERWQSPVTAAMLSSEYRRIFENTRRPDLLAELSRALDDDKRRVAECLVRPLLTEQLFSDRYGSDQDLHAETLAVAVREVERLRTGAPASYGKVRRNVILQGDPQYEATYQALIGRKQESGDVRIAPESGWVGGKLAETPSGFSAVRARTGSTGSIEVEQYSLPKIEPRRWLEDMPRHREQELEVIAVDTQGLTTAESVAAVCPVGEWVGKTHVFDPLLPKRPIVSTHVWTGAEWLIWGQGQRYNAMEDGVFANLAGMIYDPTLDRWTPMSQEGQPDVVRVSSVWTGSEMIVWGGCRDINESTGLLECGEQGEGWAYNPQQNQWRNIASDGAPLGKVIPAATWTGSEMVVWSGCKENRAIPDAAAYDPLSDSWRMISEPPLSQFFESAAWTGEEVLFSGGRSNAAASIGSACGISSVSLTSRVQLYNPETDSWRVAASEGGPSERLDASTAWVGGEWFVWGGRNFDNFPLNTGARYRPSTDSWHPVTSTGAPTARLQAGTVAAGGEVIVFGGSDPNLLGNGARFLPGAGGGSWIPLPPSGAPPPRSAPMMAWTGSELLVSGGNCGGVPACREDGRLVLGSTSWSALLSGGIGAPGARSRPRGSTDGVRAVVGSSDWVLPAFVDYAGVYDPVIDRWGLIFAEGRPLNDLNAELGLFENSVMVFGGREFSESFPSPSGAVFDLGLKAWSKNIPEPPGWITDTSGTIRVAAAPYAFVWGGFADGENLATGFVYDLRTEQWQTVSTESAPAPRRNAIATVDNGRVYLWGGNNQQQLLDGGIYDIENDAWEPIHGAGNTPPFASSTDSIRAVDGGLIHFDLSTKEMRVYSTASQSWSLVDDSGGPNTIDDPLNSAPSLVWNGRDILMWGGITGDGGAPLEKTNGFGLTLDTETWSRLSVANSPGWRREHVGLNLGPYMMVWGGSSAPDNLPTSTGGLYCMDTRTEIGEVDLVALPEFEQSEVVLGQLARLVAQVENSSAEFATNVEIVIDAQDQLIFQGLQSPETAACTTPAQGDTGLIVCSIGTLIPGASRDVTVDFQPFALGSFPVNLTAAATEVEDAPSNNEAVATLAVVSAPIVSTVTPTAGTGGTIDPDTPQTINEGETATFTITPDAGYSIDSVGGTCGGSLAGDQYTTDPVIADCSVEASFKINNYTVTPMAGTGGSIDPNTPQTINHGETTTFTIIPEPGFVIVSVAGTCGGSLAGDQYTTDPITGDCSVEASFEIDADEVVFEDSFESLF